MFSISSFSFPASLTRYGQYLGLTARLLLGSSTGILAEEPDHEKSFNEIFEEL